MGKTLSASATGMQADSEFRVTELQILPRDEAHVASKNELAAYASHAAPDLCDADDGHLRKPHKSVHQNGQARGPDSRHDISKLAGQIEMRQVKVGKRTLEYDHPQGLTRFHPDKEVLERLKEIPIDYIEGRIVEHSSPVPRRFLDDPYRRR